MITRSPIKKDKMYYQALGHAPKQVLGARDYYRFKRVTRYLTGDSVLDVGCGRADFLKLVRPKYRIGGTEVTGLRVEDCSAMLGQNAVRLGNLEQRLGFDSNSFDTVTCLEVLEHTEDPRWALEELVRVSRKRVIITVPFDEPLRYVLCMHCARHTPYSGHLHSFNTSNIMGILPGGVAVVNIHLLGNRLLTRWPGARYIFGLPTPIVSPIDEVLNRLRPSARWMMVVLDKSEPPE